MTPIADLFGKKLKIGSFCGFLVYLGLFMSSKASYHVSIPMYLVNRRCMILATVSADYFYNRKMPNSVVKITAFLYCLGSLIAGWENLETEYFGFLIVWLCNFTQAFGNGTIQKQNKSNLINSFDTCLFFSLMGSLFTIPYIIYSGNYQVTYDLVSTQTALGENTFLMLLCFSSVCGLFI